VTGQPRPLRRDAQRNRAALLDAARATFAERGLDAPLEAVAQRAGVAIGTLYRHFPARADLVDAIVIEKLGTWAEAGQQALETDDPWDGFVHLLRRMCELQSQDRAFNQVACRDDGSDASPDTTALRRRIMEQMTSVVRRAQEAGALRRDFGLDDMALLVLANAGVAEGTADPARWRRHVELMMDALRATPARNT